MFNDPVPLGREQKTDFLVVLKNTPTMLFCDGVYNLFLRENKKRNLTGPKGQFKIPYTLQSLLLQSTPINGNIVDFKRYCLQFFIKKMPRLGH